MKDQDDPQAVPLARIADALEHLVAAQDDSGRCEWTGAPAFIWDGQSPRAVSSIEAPDLDLLRGINKQKAAVTQNVRRHGMGHAAHDMLLWGARGMGKSALIRAAVRHVQDSGHDLALVQVPADSLAALPDVFAQLGSVRRQFIVYCDDLGFSGDDPVGARQLRSCLDGGVQARPANVRLAVTSNRRAIVPRHVTEQDDPINPRDAVDDQLALADRFGLSLGFHACSQDDYLEIVLAYSRRFDLPCDVADALEWAKRRGARSGRVAWHYVTEVAGRTGRAI